MQNFLSRKHAFFRLPLFKLRAYAEGVTDEDEYGSMLTVRKCHRPASAHQQLPLASAPPSVRRQCRRWVSRGGRSGRAARGEGGVMVRVSVRVREEEGERQHGNERKRKRQKRIEPHRSVTFHNSTALLSSHHDDFAFTRQKSRSTVEFIVTGTEGRRFV